MTRNSLFVAGALAAAALLASPLTSYGQIGIGLGGGGRGGSGISIGTGGGGGISIGDGGYGRGYGGYGAGSGYGRGYGYGNYGRGYGYGYPGYGYSRYGSGYRGYDNYNNYGYGNSGYYTQPSVRYYSQPAVVASAPASAAYDGPGVAIRNLSDEPLNFTLDDSRRMQIEPGDTQRLMNKGQFVISFDRGSEKGRARYTIHEGTYEFTPTDSGWELFRKNNSAVADDRNPEANIRTAERPQFREQPRLEEQPRVDERPRLDDRNEQPLEERRPMDDEALPPEPELE
jgi:hypothetical protein